MLTETFPFLLPLRVAQRKAFFYAGMRLDGRAYARALRRDFLPHTLFTAGSGLYNADTGFPMVYQENKVFNLKLAAANLNGLMIRPGETFSFWRAVKGADRHAPYRDGLVVTNGKLRAAPGGGLCQLSNLLFWLFLHAPLTIVERHTHRNKDFPTMRDAEPEGVDATVSEGWLDLKVRNETGTAYQIAIGFDETTLTGKLLADSPPRCLYEIEGRDLTYYRERGGIYQEIAIVRSERDARTGALIAEKPLYRNRCRVGYPLPEGTPVLAAAREGG